MAYSPVFLLPQQTSSWQISAIGYRDAVLAEVRRRRADPGHSNAAQAQIESAKAVIETELATYFPKEVIQVEASGFEWFRDHGRTPRRFLNINIESIELLPSPNEA